MRFFRLLNFWFAAIALASVTAAQSATPEVILRELNRPCGIAFRPGGTADRFDVFIAESGAGRVVRWSAATPGRTVEAVTGFKVSGEFNRFVPQGPVALAFLDPGLMVVGASTADGGALVRSYELPEDGARLDATTDQTAARRAAANSVCLSLARTRVNEFVGDALVMAIHDGGRNALLKSRVQAGIVGQPRPFNQRELLAAPRVVATSPAGRIVVADDKGTLTFYNPIDGDAELRLTTKLEQIVGLAYSPTTGSLYAADFAAGLYRIDDASQPGKPACNPVRLADIKQASALAFAPDGSLYVVTFGDGTNGTLQVLAGNQ